MFLIYSIISNTPNTGISFVDSTSIAVCHNKRIRSNKVFKFFAEIAKSTKGWFYGFKLHLVINNRGQVQSLSLTPVNVDDRIPMQRMVKNLTGLLFGDKGYIKQSLFEDLYKKGLKLVTGLKKTMKTKLINTFEKQMLRKRSIIETVFDYLKNKFSLEHTRHRSPDNFLVHILSTIAAYSLKSNKPSVNMNNFKLLF